MQARMGEIAKASRNERLWLVAILLVAVATRAWTFRPYALHHPDELYQYLEQAHRLITGLGIVPWEYRAEMRSWLPPLLLTLPMRLGEAISPGSQLPVFLARALVAVISLAPLLAAYALGRRISPTHGLVAAAVFAIWFENIFYSGYVLMEVLAFACFLPAAALLRPDGSRRATMIAGALLASTLLLRFHYGPALAVFTLITVGRRWDQWKLLVVGGLIVMLVSGLVDAAMGQVPFGWIASNINENVIKGGANRFGVSGPYFYFYIMLERWESMAPVLLFLPLYVARKYPGLLCAALANLVVHMAIGHKEYRFIWLTVEILLLLSAIASVSLLRSVLGRWMEFRWANRLATVSLLAGWAAASAALAATDKVWPNWDRFAARMQTMADAGRRPELCGLAVYGIDYWSASYSYFQRDEPIYFPWRPVGTDLPVALRQSSPGYNFIMAPARRAAEVPVNYREHSCRSDGSERICLYRRDGPCDPVAAKHDLLQIVIAKYGY